ncbi:hypothetical protein [Clostridium sardiniense]|uniref:hypothetical protein n=1 Tax=Clostridium sardiniense TaxID=29369 RepID=UPI00195B48BF|nr:hypothetical protein [Clostridium sardiniense]MBM7836247.1 amino acid transporter [Clostridium sardiniense]
MTEKHSMKSLRILAISNILINILGNILLYLNLKGYSLSLFDGININLINQFTAFTLIALALGAIFNKSPKLSEEDRFIVKSKLKPLLFLNIIFILYSVITIIIFKNMSLFISSLIMEASYIAVIIYSKIIYSLLATDRKLKWQQAMSGADSDMNDSSIFWRFKIWFYPLEKVPFKQRYFSKFSIFYAVIFIYFCYDLLFKSILVWLFLIGILKSLLALIEYIFGLYTSLTGICTGIDEFNDDNDNKRYFTIYVTDFVHKREIVYSTYDTPYFNKNGKVKLIHGIFSKKVIIANNIKIKYR